MGLSLTEQQDVIVCTKDVIEGNFEVNDRYLAPAISRFAADMRRKGTTTWTGKLKRLEKN